MNQITEMSSLSPDVLPKEVDLPHEILALSKEFIGIFSNWPVYDRAIRDSYWQSTMDEELGQGNAIRFEDAGVRYAVEIRLNRDGKKAFVCVRRRPTEGITEVDMPGTSSEDLVPNYWKEQARLSFNSASPAWNQLLHFKEDPTGKLVSLRDKDAIDPIRKMIKELRGRLPFDAKFTTVNPTASPAGSIQ